MRPESIELALKSEGDLTNRFEVNLQHLTYLGESEQLQLYKGDVHLKLNLFNAVEHGLTDGDVARIHIPKNAALVLPHDSNLGTGT